jgi:hypothetical protein
VGTTTVRCADLSPGVLDEECERGEGKGICLSNEMERSEGTGLSGKYLLPAFFFRNYFQEMAAALIAEEEKMMKAAYKELQIYKRQVKQAKPRAKQQQTTVLTISTYVFFFFFLLFEFCVVHLQCRPNQRPTKILPPYLRHLWTRPHKPTRLHLLRKHRRYS